MPIKIKQGKGREADGEELGGQGRSLRGGNTTGGICLKWGTKHAQGGVEVVEWALRQREEQ